MSNISAIRPGIMVQLRTTIVGGVKYQRRNLDTGELVDVDSTTPASDDSAGDSDSGSESEVTRWETIKTVLDREEYDRAVKARGKLSSLIRKVCSETAFGLLCPTNQESALDVAIAAARAVVDAINPTLRYSQIGVYVLKGQVQSNDAEALRAITKETANLMKRIDDGIKAFDPDAVRGAAKRAQELASMLSEDQEARVSEAIKQARKAARELTKKLGEEGANRSTILLDIQRGQIESARIAMLDLCGERGEPVEPTSVASARTLDLDASDEVPACITTTTTMNKSAIELPEVQ